MDNLDERLANALGYGDKAKKSVDSVVDIFMQIVRNTRKDGDTEEMFNKIEAIAKDALLEFCDKAVKIFKERFTTDELEEIIACHEQIVVLSEKPAMKKMRLLDSEIRKEEDDLYYEMSNKIYREATGHFQSSESVDDIPIDMSKN